MNEPMECPRCKEITLKHINTETGASGKVYEEWECSCGEYQIMDVPKPYFKGDGTITADGLTILPESEWPEIEPESKYPGFDEFYHSIDPDVLDSMSMLERMQIAWMAGCTYSDNHTIERLKPLRDKLAGLENSVSKQAE